MSTSSGGKSADRVTKDNANFDNSQEQTELLELINENLELIVVYLKEIVGD